MAYKLGSRYCSLLICQVQRYFVGHNNLNFYLYWILPDQAGLSRNSGCFWKSYSTSENLSPRKQTKEMHITPVCICPYPKGASKNCLWWVMFCCKLTLSDRRNTTKQYNHKFVSIIGLKQGKILNKNNSVKCLAVQYIIKIACASTCLVLYSVSFVLGFNITSSMGHD